MACGSRDAQTLALTEEGLVYSWGDGDFGKLGEYRHMRTLFPWRLDLNILMFTQILAHFLSTIGLTSRLGASGTSCLHVSCSFAWPIYVYHFTLVCLRTERRELSFGALTRNHSDIAERPMLYVCRSGRQ